MSNPIYTVEAGRCIMKNGKPFVSLQRCGETSPVDADEACHTIVKALNTLPRLLDVVNAAIVDGRLQTFEDRERFRRVARKVINLEIP